MNKGSSKNYLFVELSRFCVLVILLRSFSSGYLHWSNFASTFLFGLKLFEHKMQSNRIEIKHVIQCKFCGGKNCEYEDYTKWKSKKNTHIAIEGLFSNWITDHIIATQRPSSRLIKEHNIIQQFKEYVINKDEILIVLSKQVNAIINLQLAGEHPECGDGLAKADGFSYLPEEFMDHGSKKHLSRNDKFISLLLQFWMGRSYNTSF